MDGRGRIKMAKMIEVGLVWEDGTWTTDYFEIPSNTKQGDYERVAVDMAIEEIRGKEPLSDLAHAFMYSIVSEELEE
jgi:hypothetical protein